MQTGNNPTYPAATKMLRARKKTGHIRLRLPAGESFTEGLLDNSVDQVDAEASAWAESMRLTESSAAQWSSMR
jgi:hypothetical protein